MDKNRARGALLGLAVGDAFGATLEFSDPDEYPDFPTLMTGPHTEVIGGGPFGLQKGQTTDDTQMALCLAESLHRGKSFDAQDILNNYRTWIKITQDAGRLTKRALKIGGYEAWKESNHTSAGNGSLMRTTPCAVIFADSHPIFVTEITMRDSALTHYDLRCQFACAMHNAAIQHALTTKDPTPESMWEAARKGLANSAYCFSVRPYVEQESEFYLPFIKQAIDGLAEDTLLAKEDDPRLYDFTAAFLGNPDDPTDADLDMIGKTGGLSITGTSMGFVRVAFRLAFWELLHAPSFEAGMLDVVNRGGDSDTNGAIAGALLGALYGYDKIPGRWSLPVLTYQSMSEPFNTLYHPINFLKILDAI